MIFLFLFAMAAMVLADDNLVFPTPKISEFVGQTTRVQETVVHMRDGSSSGDIWNELPAGIGGGYALRITTGRTEVWANDEDGLYYAKQTLSQLLRGVPGANNAQEDPFPQMDIDQVAKLGELPVGLVVDWPDLPYRGVVEGYYGVPWSKEARCSQFAFYGRNKMNTYIYAPKDDPYHHGRGCYEAYPPDKAQELRQLVECARKNHVRFVWAIHPANTVRWEVDEGRSQLEALCSKLESMYELGVRDFGLLFDDTTGEIGCAQRQVQLSNYITENFIRKHPDVNQTLIMCPTGYNRSWAKPEELHMLGEGLDPATCVMWTGDTVVHDITLDGQRWVNHHLGRPTFIWWNWPCNDFKPNRLSMGRAYGMGTEEEMKSQMSGFVANPMAEAEAGKVGLFGVANYTWNIVRYDSLRTWEQGIARLYPNQTEAMKLFCEHNSHLLPNNHGYDREESTRSAATAKRLMINLGEERQDAESARALTEEYNRIRQAGQQLLDTPGRLHDEILPWLTQFEMLGHAGTLAMQTLLEPDTDKKLPIFMEAMDVVNKMRTTQRRGWDGRRVIGANDVEVAMYVMGPALLKALEYSNHFIYALMAGRDRVWPVFSTSCGNANDNPQAIRDGNSDTFWSSQTRQQAGDWFCLDFGAPVDVRRINLLMGGVRALDYVLQGQFEISDDGEHWSAVGGECEGPAAVLNLGDNPVRTRMVRFRITKPNDKWVSIYEFTINRIPTSYVVSNMSDRPKLRAVEYQDTVGIGRVMEVLTMRPGEFLDLQVPSLVDPLYIEINLENDEVERWGTLELTAEDGHKIPVRLQSDHGVIFLKNPVQQPIRSMRLTNTGAEPRQIRITRFCLGYAAGEGATSAQLVTDQDLTTGIDCGSKEVLITIPRPPGVREAIVVGTAACSIEGAQEVSVSPHLHHFNLPQGEKPLRLSAPQQTDKFINEIILK